MTADPVSPGADDVQAEGPPPFLVFGCPRSGTSLLSRILNAHSQITVPEESFLAWLFYPYRAAYGDLNEASNRQKLIREMLASYRIRTQFGPMDAKAIEAGVRSPTFGGVMAALMAHRASRDGKPIWGEKSPQHVHFAEPLIRDIPRLRLVRIVRDGRDVAVSLRSVKFGPKDAYTAGRYWTRYLAAAQAVEDRWPQRMHTLRYEDLTAHPESVLTGVCQHLGVTFEPGMLEFFKHDAPEHVEAKNTQQLRQPLLAGNSGKWRQAMTPKQLRLFEVTAGPTLLAHGYETACDAPTVSRLERLTSRWGSSFWHRLQGMASNRLMQIETCGRWQRKLRATLTPKGRTHA